MDVRLRQLMYLAREHYENREYEKAEPLLRQVVSEHQGFADIFNLLGVIQHSQSRFTLSDRLARARSNSMTQFYGDVVANLVRRAALLYDYGMGRQAGTAAARD